MLEQKTELVEFEESKIIDYSKLYLITWSPDPKEMPDSDFYLQHQTNVSTLSDYLKCCECGLFCVESSQLGNPHYHGWYQVSDAKELGRIAVVKTMQRFGIVKITEAKHYKIFNWEEKGNALYYYKKDLCDSFLTIEPNPIDLNTETTMNFEQMELIGFFNKDKGMTTIADKVSARKFYRQFYKDTMNFLD